MISKVCPICKQDKPESCYGRYFSKSRQKYRLQNYCNDCAKIEKTKRSAEYFKKNRSERLQYAKDYRANPDNREKLKITAQKFKVKYREELQDCYMRDYLVQRGGFDNADLLNHPEVVQSKRLQLKIKRKIKEHGKK